jgi:hypothetical protein
MEEKPRKHRISFLRIWSLIDLIFLPLGLIMFFDPSARPADYLYYALAVIPAAALFGLPFWLAYPYGVLPEGLLVRPTAFKSVLVPWGEIGKPKPRRFLFLRFVTINRGSLPSLLLFLDVADKSGLMEDVRRCAPPENPLRVYLETGELVENRPAPAPAPSEGGPAQPEQVPARPGDKPTPKTALDSSVRNGANWFFWIAALSALNTASFLLGFNWTFIVGLAATQIVDGLSIGFSSAVGGSLATVFTVISVFTDLFIAGLFVLFGVFARKGHGWSFLTGMILYALDTIIPPLFGDYLSLAFHLVALFFILTGYVACRKLKAAS